jgi:hypothetical protein
MAATDTGAAAVGSWDCRQPLTAMPDCPCLSHSQPLTDTHSHARLSCLSIHSRSQTLTAVDSHSRPCLAVLSFPFTAPHSRRWMSQSLRLPLPAMAHGWVSRSFTLRPGHGWLPLSLPLPAIHSHRSPSLALRPLGQQAGVRVELRRQPRANAISAVTVSNSTTKRGAKPRTA